MKAKKFHEMSTQELLQQETELKTELFNLRFQHATGQLSNPIVIKAALNLLGLPGGHLRKPYEDYTGAKLEHLKETMTQMGVIEKYHISNDTIEI